MIFMENENPETYGLRLRATMNIIRQACQRAEQGDIVALRQIAEAVIVLQESNETLYNEVVFHRSTKASQP